MIRVVLDTNIIVSALLQPYGPPAQVFVLAIGGSIQLCISGSVYSEYEEVVNRPRFRLSEDTINGALHTIREKSFWVRPTETIRACSDSDDDIFLECAHAAQANYLVTGNLKHFHKSWSGTQIVPARRMLNIISGGTEEAPVSI
jgi:putative PIN family toxin of toxin-antitoxin system